MLGYLGVPLPTPQHRDTAHLIRCVLSRYWMYFIKKSAIQVKKQSLLWPGASQRRIYYHHKICGVNYQLLALIVYWSSPNAELLVAVDHSQLWTMASLPVDPIDWSHPPPASEVPPERLVHSTNRCSLSSTGNWSCNFSMRGNHSAYAATQGIGLTFVFIYIWNSKILSKLNFTFYIFLGGNYYFFVHIV